MASTINTVQYVLDQAGLGSRLTYKKMFGEYALYLDDKVVAFICDDQLFLKPTSEGRAYLEVVSEAPPYPGAKNYYVLTSELDDPDRLGAVLKITAAALPAPGTKAARARSKPDSVSLSAKLQRKAASLPVYVVIPAKSIARWKLKATTVVEGTAQGHPLGRRNMKACGKGSDDWFVELTAAFCKIAGLKVGDAVALQLRKADTSLPQELATILAGSKLQSEAWSKLTEAQKRDAAEHIHAARTAAARVRRAKAIVDKLHRARH